MQKTSTSKSVGLAADLAMIDGRFSSYLRERGYSERTSGNFRLVLRAFAPWLARRRRRLVDINLEDVPYLVRYFSLRRCLTCKEERRAALHAWLRFGGRFKPTVAASPWQCWLDDHLKFLADHRGHVPSTLDARRRVVRTYLQWQFGRQTPDWSRVGAKDIIRYSHELAQQPLSRLVVKGRLSALRQFLRYLLLRGVGSATLVEAVPSISAYGQPSRRTQALSEQQRKQLLAAFPRRTPTGRRNYAMAICMIDLGLRISEMIALRVDSIDWTERHLAVPPVKNGRGRMLPLQPRVYAALRAYVERGRPASGCRQLFLCDTKLRGTPLTTGAARNQITQAFKRCGFPASWGGVHRLRHTFASRLHARGADLKQIADLLGHRGFETTNLYAQIDVSELRPLVQPWPLAS